MTVNPPEPLVFLLEHPLYESISFGTDSATTEYLEKIHSDIEHYDCFCMQCGKTSVFHIDHTISKHMHKYGPFIEMIIVANCTRSNEHAHIFKILLEKGDGVLCLKKIGQYPSLADIANAGYDKYRKILKTTKFSEFTRAIGLASHGIGIGAFVYLRRVFESLIEEAHSIARKSTGWDEEEYNFSKVENRIKLLEYYLPDFLINNRSIYGILSKGVHELNEAECRSIFPAMKSTIELILDAKIKEKEATAEITDLKQKLRNK